MTWLVTGGAGYIGSHVVDAFRAADLPVVVLDDLSTGNRDVVPVGVPLVHASILDTEAVTEALRAHQVTGVLHLAGFKFAGVSVERPLHTYEQNVTGTASLLRAMQDAAVTRMVFSSSAAVYGTPQGDVVTEETATRPESPYGESKLVGEWLLRDVGRSAGVVGTSLRYFNVVGAARPELYDASGHNLFPLVLTALAEGRTPVIYGTDYPTPDGTCVRDYVHVADLAHSHVAAARRLEAGEPVEPVYNLGSGHGVSVREIMAAAQDATGVAFTPQEAPRRAGDPARIVARGELAARDLDWEARHTVPEMVAGAWAAQQRHTQQRHTQQQHDRG